MNPQTEFKYWAFISYSHQDNREDRNLWAEWLHDAIESFKVPEELIGKPGRSGELVPDRLFPAFQDEKELPTNADLGAAIREALRQSRYLVVICSPRAARSVYVNEEVMEFKRLRRPDRVLAIIVDGEPNASEPSKGLDPALECFPPALRHPVGPDGNLDRTQRAEPIAGDVRGTDGKEASLNNKGHRPVLDRERLRVISGLLGIGFDELVQRDRERELLEARARARRLRKLVVGFATLAMVAVAASLIAAKKWGEARTQAAHRLRVVKFLEEMLVSVGPYQRTWRRDQLGSRVPAETPSRDWTILREMLDQAAMRADRSLTNQPEIAGEVRVTLAQLYHDLGLYKRMEEVAWRNLEQSQSALGSEHLLVARSLSQLGDACEHLGDHERAEAYCTRSVDLSKKLFGSDHPEMATALNGLAHVLLGRNKPSEAEALFREALRVETKAPGAENSEVAVTLNNLALALQRAGKVREAEKCFSQALDIERKLVGPAHPLIASSLNNLALLIKGQGRAAEAEKMLREALTMEVELLGYEHPETAQTLCNLADTLADQRNFPEAQRLNEQALGIQRRLFPANHPLLIASLNNLAATLWNQGKMVEAEAALREAYSHIEQPSPADPSQETPIQGTVLHHLPDVLLRLHKSLSEARSMAQDAVAMYRRHPDWPMKESNHAFEVLRSVQSELGELPAENAVPQTPRAVAERSQ